MPRKGGKSRKRGGGSDVVNSVWAHFFNPLVLVAGSNQVALAPSFLGTSISSTSDGYSLFRIRSMWFRILALTTGAAAGVITSFPNTLPSTRNLVMELVDAVDHEAGAQSNWTEKVRVHKAVLAGPFPWYHTRQGTFDISEVVPAVLQIVGTGTAVVLVEIMIDFEFKDPVPTASTPAELAMLREFRALRAKDDDTAARVRLLKQLCGLPPSGDVPSAVKAIFQL